jgi:Mycothiol maleylpyruvate isomerase N-terminal domain
LTVLDLEPPARQIITLAGAVTDDMLQAPTPCGDYTVADLLAHMMGLTIAFRDAAAKAGSPTQDAAPAGLRSKTAGGSSFPGGC